MEKTAGLIDALVPTIWKFDGKVYNARLENALQKELDDRQSKATLHIRNFEESTIQFDLSFSGRDERCIDYIEVSYWKEQKFSKDRCLYLPSCYDSENIIYFYDTERRDKNFSDSCVDSWMYYDSNFNRRIKADKVVNLLQKRQKEIREKIENLKKELEKKEEYERRLNEIKSQLEQLHKEIPYQYRDFFGLKSYANWH